MNAQAVKALVTFFTGLSVLVLSAPGGFAQEKIDGMVVGLKITRCGMKPGTCEGTVEIGEPGKARGLQVEPGTTTIKKGGKVVVLQELRLGDKVRAEFERKEGKDVARLIEARKGRPLAQYERLRGDGAEARSHAWNPEPLRATV